jgi:hypothetical protein
MMLSAAPFFEDVFLQRCLGSLGGGSLSRLAYAELAPADPAHSVSQWFDLSGCRGIIIVPPDQASAWRGARPNAEITSAVRDDLWEAAKPFGFIRFASMCPDAASIIAAAQPLIVLSATAGDIAGYRHIQDAGMAGVAPHYFVRADHAEDFAPLLGSPLARDEFRTEERQAAALGRMLTLSETASAELRADLDRAHQETGRRDREIESRNQDIQARNREIEARDRDVQARDREIEALNRDIQARDQTIMARDREIAALHQIIASRDQELARLRPQAEALVRLAAMLDWPQAPRALRAVLPLARVLRRLSA